MPPTADEYRAGLLALQQQQRARLTSLIEQIDGSLAYDWQRGMGAAASLYGPILDQYARDLAALREAEDDPAARLGLDWLTGQRSKLATIQASVAASADKYGAHAAQTITHAQEAATQQAAMDAAQLTQRSLWPAVEGAGVPPSVLFNRPNPDAIAQWVGRAGNGHPLGDLFEGFGAEATQGARQAMMLGLLTGANPKAMASGIASALGISRSRATIISRTEVLGSYRSAAHETYRANSDVLSGWIWSAGGQSPCAQCMGMDGLQFSLSEELLDHVCGKCAPIPITKSWSDILGPLGIDASDMEETSMGAEGAYETGPEKFARMSPQQQRAIIGTKTGYEAYRRGEVELQDFIGKRAGEDGFPASYYQKSLKEMEIPTGRSNRMVEPNPRFTRPGGFQPIERGMPIPVDEMPKWAQQSEASRAAYQIMRNGLPYNMSAHELPLLQMNLEQMLTEELPLNVRLAALRQIDVLKQYDEYLTRYVRNVTSGASTLGKAPEFVYKPSKELERALAAARAGERDVVLHEGETTATRDAVTPARSDLPDVGPTKAYETLVHEHQQSDVAWFADMHDMTVEEYKSAVAAKIQEAVNADVISVRYPQSTLEKILDDGRLKTTHEVGGSGSSAVTSGSVTPQMYAEMRAKYEAEAFSYPMDLPAELRPISGYIAPLAEDDPMARGWGDARIVLNDDVRARSTMTYSDSLQNDYVLPRPVDDIKYDVFPFAAGNERGFPRDIWAGINDPLTGDKLGNSGIRMGYMEAQIHGGVKSSDIAEVIFNDGHIPSAALQEKLADAGIPWRVESDVTPDKAAIRDADAAIKDDLGRAATHIKPDDVAKWTADNADGVPSIGYHAGTPEHILRLDQQGIDVARNLQGTWGRGFYMHMEHDVTARYGSAEVQVAIRMQKPFVIDNPKAWQKLVDQYAKGTPHDWDVVMSRFTDDLIAKGYDGIIVRAEQFNLLAGTPGADLDEIIAIKPGTVRVIEGDAERALEAAQTTETAAQAGAREVEAATSEAHYEQLRQDAANLSQLLRDVEPPRPPVEALAEHLDGNPAISKLAEKLGWEQGKTYEIYGQFGNITDASPEMAAISQLQETWNGVIGMNGDPMVVAMRMAVRDEFGFPMRMTGVDSDVMAEARSLYRSAGEGLRALARATHDETQAWFEKQGITEINVFRGRSWADAPANANLFDGSVSTVKVPIRAISSWSTDPEVAYMYASESNGDYAMLAMDRVPVSQIWSTAYAGFGTPGEAEVLLMGNMQEMDALSWNIAEQDIDYENAIRQLMGLPPIEPQGE